MSRPAPPIVFFAFANDRVDKARYLRNLPEEQRRVLEAMAGHSLVYPRRVEPYDVPVGQIGASYSFAARSLTVFVWEETPGLT